LTASIATSSPTVPETKMKGRSLVHGELQCGEAVERRKLVVREDDIDASVLESGHEFGARLDAGGFADDMLRFKEPLNELCVACVVLQQEDVERRRHNTFFTLPGGG
jgi:hypothetical protein